jgi:hypothetical protein
MKKNFTSINLLLDASGSMASLVNDTIGGVNSFLKEQKELPGEAVVSLCTFNTNATVVYDFLPISKVPLLDKKTYKASGGTALYDAMGLSIDNLGKKLSNMKEEDRPDKVLFLIVSDGEENSSHLLIEPKANVPPPMIGDISGIVYGTSAWQYFPQLRYPLDTIKEMVLHQTNNYKWTFTYMGANLDAMTVGQTLGVAAQNTMQYCADSAGTKSLYSIASQSTSNYRSSGSSDTGFFKGVK